MNVHQRIALPDVQSEPDRRNVDIDGVGVKGVRYPVSILSGGNTISTVAALSLTVSLAAGTKGTHMSRFIELLEAEAETLDQKTFGKVVRIMLDRLQADSGEIEMKFPYFRRKTAPVSGVGSWLDYDVTWRGRIADNGACTFRMSVTVPTTSLCPCSKEISAYGAHNQRSHITVEVEPAADYAIEELIALAERCASCELFGLLKRPDEKYVTERAYENPRFVEDLVRDVVLALNEDPRILAFSVEAENFESIHNHSAVARIERPAGPNFLNDRPRPNGDRTALSISGHAS